MSRCTCLLLVPALASALRTDTLKPRPHKAGENWRVRCLEVARKDSLHQSLMAGRGDVYEFGVWKGDSMKLLRKSFGLPTRMWGFDSFVGLPETLGDVKQHEWNTHVFRADFFNTTRLAETLGGSDVAAFIRGFFNESLTPNLRSQRGMGPAEYIDVDCDLYISSRQALDWAFTTGVAVPGTLVGYDDWFVNPCSKGGEALHPLETGEGKAHTEIAEKHGVRFRCVSGRCTPGAFDNSTMSGVGIVFVVEAVGVKPESGFHWSREELASFKKNDRICNHTSVDPLKEVTYSE